MSNANVKRKMKWTTVDSRAAQVLTTLTNSPGVVYAVATNALPDSLKQISGVASYYVSGYVNPQALSNGVTVAGEMLVARIDGATTKNRGGPGF